MKAIFILLSLTFSLVNLFGQRDYRNTHPKIEWDALNVTVSQSTIKNNRGPRLAVDGISVPTGNFFNSNNGNYISTYFGDFPEGQVTSSTNIQPWWQIDLGDWHNIEEIAISTPEVLNNYYILFSALEFNSHEISDFLEDDWVSYYHITSALPQETAIPTGVETPVRYIRIQSDSYDNPIKISEVDIFGTVGVGNPFTNGNGLSFGEDCSDGIDNDNDGLIDCEDWPCKVSNYNTVFIEPTCPICNDGEICITSYVGDRVSIDGGQTYYSLYGEHCFTGLSQGSYSLEFLSKWGCPSTEEDIIDLYPPIGVRTSLCGNGDFEDGEFTGWTGGIGVNTDGGPHFDNTTIEPTRHEIIATSTFEDPYLPSLINGNFEPLGEYIARLGNDNTGAESERLTFCFDVTEENADFSFWYAVVTQNPGHDDHENPYFQYKIFEPGFINDPILRVRTISNDPFLESFQTFSIRYKPWTCSNTDLTEFIGKEVCIEFISADCTETVHFGYAYIDGLCTDAPTAPTISIVNDNNDIYCDNQVITVQGVGQGFNSYKWGIKESLNGEIVNSVESEIIIDPNPLIEDLVVYYEELGDVELFCGSELIVSLEVFNDCSSMGTATGIYNIICNEFTIAYCNPQINCSVLNTNEIQILGINDCEDCDIVWSPSNTLSDPNAKFPIISDLNFADAFFNDYMVQVTTPEGCIYRDTVSIQQNLATLSVTNEVGGCNFMINGTIDLLMDVPNENLNVNVFNTLGGDTFIETLIPEGTGLTRTFNKIYLRDFSKEFRYELEIVNFGDNCVEGECQDIFLGEEVPWSHYLGYWNAFWPNIFSPNGDGNNDVFNLTFRSADDNFADTGCQRPMDEFLSSVTGVELDIFHGWGDEVFNRHLFIDPLVDLNGILGNEDILTWDGNFSDGSPATSGVYAFVVTVHTCYGEENNNCENPDDLGTEYLAEGGGTVSFGADFTLIR